MAFEGPEKKTPLRGRLREAVGLSVLSASLLSYDSHQPKALEIPPHYTWQQGVDVIHQSVLEEPVENGIMMAVSPDDSVIWFKSQTGMVTAMPNDYAEIGFQGIVDNKMPIDRACVIHTHPVAAGVAAFGLTKEEALRMSAPPSVNDIHLFTPIHAEMLGIRTPELQGLKVITAEFDPRGVWYHRFATKEERGVVEARASEREEKEAMDRFSERLVAYTKASTSEDTDFGPAYEALRADYLSTFGIVVRFASYEELKNEPPCAGPDYKPKER